MNRKVVVMFLFMVLIVIEIFAVEPYDLLKGFRVKLGMKHILRWDTRRMGDPDQDGYFNSDVPVAFIPEDYAQLSIGAEYLYPLSNSLAIGLGYEYNSIMRVSKFYHNNALSRDGSKQIEKKYYSHNLQLPQRHCHLDYLHEKSYHQDCQKLIGSLKI